MPVIGGEQWAMSCTLNLASCRLRAETLARQLHSKLWSPRSEDGSISPCFGFPPTAAPVVDTPPLSLGVINGHCPRMSSLDDDDDCPPHHNNKVDIVVTPPMHMSPPYSPTEKLTSVTPDLIASSEHGMWRPDSPPDSLPEQHTDSPTGTFEDPCVDVDSNSTETASDLASPTYDLNMTDKGSTLADELCSRLRQFQSLQIESNNSMSSPQDELPQNNVFNSTCSVSETSSGSQSLGLLSPEVCPRLVRSTSLKTGKTPPDTPSRKKIVRFADVLGLDLEAVRHFVEDDDTPIVPQSAFADLKLPPPPLAPLPWVIPGQTNASCRFVPQFQQPVSDPHFLDKVREQKICLENIIVNDLRATVVVRVLNLGFQKLVEARLSTTEWAAHEDLTADYVPNSCDGFSDKFSFTIHQPHMCAGQRLVFALRYVANGQEFWDNNQGNNYVLRCQASEKKQEGGGGGENCGTKWMHHFM